MGNDQVSDYDYNLPEELIAQTPLEDRSSSRLLHLEPESGKVTHRAFRDVPDLLRAGDLLVFNNTRVTALRLYGRRAGGGSMEALVFGSAGRPDLFRAMTRPAKRLKPGAVMTFEGDLAAEVAEDLGDGFKLIRFKQLENLKARLAAIGQVPLPPYIHEKLADPGRYQTVFASAPGSAAAPTAGLHFTPEIIQEVQEKGVGVAFVTLDVSVDTFRPMSVESISDHVMHGETCSVPDETARAIAEAKGRIIGVGTTTVRTLESFAVGRREVSTGTMATRIFITPGYEFKVVDGMFTNFHMPRTTMMLMISALAGRELIQEAYRQAVDQRYRFLSFGDSMLILD